jgi:hypothetical protein
VPEGTSRIRISLTAAVSNSEVERLVAAIPAASQQELRVKSKELSSHAE